MFFREQGKSALISLLETFTRISGATMMNNSDTKMKYTDRAAEVYKEELTRRVKEDVLRQHNIPPQRFRQTYTSSDTYFEGNAYDLEVIAKIKSRIQTFQEASFISSKLMFHLRKDSDLDSRCLELSDHLAELAESTR